MRPSDPLVLGLPIENTMAPHSAPIGTQHVQTRTFQPVTNPVLTTGRRPLSRSVIYGSSYLLPTLGKQLSVTRAVRAVRSGHGIVRLKSGHASILPIAGSSYVSTQKNLFIASAHQLFGFTH